MFLNTGSYCLLLAAAAVLIYTASRKSKNHCQKKMKPINETRYDDESIGGENDSRWAELPKDILQLIVKRLILQDSIRFGAVCISWRLIVKGGCHPPIPQLPWLMLHDATECPQAYQFYCLPEKRVYTLGLPLRGFGTCSAAYEGWLVIHRFRQISSPTQESFLLNPLTGVQVCLPKISMLPKSCDKSFIFRIILSSTPTGLNGRVNKDCLVAGVSLSGEIIFCRLGDVQWSIMRDIQGIRFVAIVFYKGILYALDGDRELWIFEFSQQIVVTKLDILHPVESEPRNNLEYMSVYLVVSGDKLLLVLRIFSIRNSDSKSGDDTEGGQEAIIAQQETKLFEVFRLDREINQWVLITSLGDRSLFISERYVMSCDDIGTGENCILFTDENLCISNIVFGISNGSANLSIFKMGDRSIEQYSTRVSFSFNNPFIWFRPNPWYGKLLFVHFKLFAFLFEVILPGYSILHLSYKFMLGIQLALDLPTLGEFVCFFIFFKMKRYPF